MSRFKRSFFVLCLLALISCGETAHDRIQNKVLHFSANDLWVESDQEVSFSIKEQDFDSLYFPGIIPKINGKNEFSFSFKKLGHHSIEVVAFYKDKLVRKGKLDVEVYSAIKPDLLTFKIASEYVHSSKNYTQGLEFKNGILYESTGQNGASRMLKYRFPSLEMLQAHNLEHSYFGEGMTVLNDTIFQLTWISKKCVLYDTALNVLGEMPFPNNEGWGLTHIKKQLIFSDGSHFLFKADKSLSIQERLPVYFADKKMAKINELESVEGFVWANIYYEDIIVKIDPNTGAVVAYVDLSELRKQLLNSNAEVLNGIAYLAELDAFLVTGKYWDKMFLIEINTAL